MGLRQHPGASDSLLLGLRGARLGLTGGGGPWLGKAVAPFGEAALPGSLCRMTQWDLPQPPHLLRVMG